MKCDAKTFAEMYENVCKKKLKNRSDDAFEC